MACPPRVIFLPGPVEEPKRPDETPKGETGKHGVHGATEPRPNGQFDGGEDPDSKRTYPSQGRGGRERWIGDNTYDPEFELEFPHARRDRTRRRRWSQPQPMRLRF